MDGVDPMGHEHHVDARDRRIASANCRRIIVTAVIADVGRCRSLLRHARTLWVSRLNARPRRPLLGVCLSICARRRCGSRSARHDRSTSCQDGGGKVVPIEDLKRRWCASRKCQPISLSRPMLNTWPKKCAAHNNALPQRHTTSAAADVA